MLKFIKKKKKQYKFIIKSMKRGREMKRSNLKRMSCLLALTVTLVGVYFINSDEVKASTQKGQSYTIFDNEKLLKTVPQLREIKKNYPDINKKLVASKDEYIKLQYKKDANNKPILVKQETKTAEDFLKEKTQVNMVTIQSLGGNTEDVNDTTKWIRLTQQIFQSYSNALKYDIYGFYEWKDSPFFMKDDIITLGHDSNMTFDKLGAYSSHTVPIPNGSEANRADYTVNFDYTAGSSHFTADIGGIAFQFPLSVSYTVNEQNQQEYPYGLMHVSANKVASSSNLTFYYSHRQATIAATGPTIKIEVGKAPSISLFGASIGSKYDTVNTLITPVF